MWPATFHSVCVRETTVVFKLEYVLLTFHFVSRLSVWMDCYQIKQLSATTISQKTRCRNNDWPTLDKDTIRDVGLDSMRY